MPSIKLKKKTQEYLAEKERSKQTAKETVEKEPVNPVPPKKKDQKTKKRDKSVENADVPIILEKRKRTVPPGEQKLADWLTEHIESRDGSSVSFQTLFEFFTDFCAEQDLPVTIDTTHFNRALRDKFGKEVGIKDSSPYKGLIKEIKPRPKSTKVKAESLTMKMKDIVEEVLKEIGNPTNGVVFRIIQKATANKYPALQVDVFPQKLLTALERGMYYGQIELVKGTGRCGFYRLQGVEPSEEVKEKEEKAKEKERLLKEEKLKKKNEKKEAGKENKEDGKADSSDEKKPKKTEDKKPKRGKRKADKTDNGTDEEPKKKKRKTKKALKRAIWEKNDPHSNPIKIDDTFPLAFTYCSEPKETSYKKIMKYLADYYPSVNLDSRLKPALEKGIEKGLWEQSTGSSVGQGSFRLILDDFNPELTKTLDDMICQAIVASHEPKSSTVIRIKQYIIDYHPAFNIELRPSKFKQALERALKNGVIKQMTGIGMTGTFQLCKPFIPSPSTLAGQETGKAEQWNDTELISDEKYVVRKTKSGRYAGRKA